MEQRNPCPHPPHSAPIEGPHCPSGSCSLLAREQTASLWLPELEWRFGVSRNLRRKLCVAELSSMAWAPREVVISVSWGRFKQMALMKCPRESHLCVRTPHSPRTLPSWTLGLTLERNKSLCALISFHHPVHLLLLSTRIQQLTSGSGVEERLDEIEAV